MNNMNMSLYEMSSHESNEGMRPECFFIVCYPCGDTSQIAVAEAQDFDVPDYNLASRYYFHKEADAERYASDLALRYRGGGTLLD